jgi:hypothetical protein
MGAMLGTMRVAWLDLSWVAKKGRTLVVQTGIRLDENRAAQLGQTKDVSSAKKSVALTDYPWGEKKVVLWAMNLADL